MADVLQASYDELPYDCQPRYATHPDCLATVATLWGMRPAPPDRCRVLELGCATGGNLIALAEALPASRFVGIDLSPQQIAAGQATVRALGLTNIELQARSILDIGDTFGRFDYIIGHGIYSWVPEDVREAILDLCRRLLAPQGVAYISYNTYPGWHQRAVVRDMLRFHVRRTAAVHERLGQARGFLDFLSRSMSGPESAYRRLVREETEQLTREKDTYLFHEHLEEFNHPVYFHQFVERAAAHGLQYLEDATPYEYVAGADPELRRALEALSADRISQEQYLDFLRNGTFRHSLLCHAGIALSRGPSAALIERMQLTSLARPTAAQPDVRSTAEVEFRSERRRVVSTNIPLVKAALVALYEAWPSPVPFDALYSAVEQRLGGAPDRDGARRQLTEAILELYLSGLAALHVHLPACVTEPSERPVASPLARLRAETDPRVPCRLNCLVDLTELDRMVLRLLDGRRDRTAMVNTLADAVAAGALAIKQDGRPLQTPAEIRGLLGDVLEPTLRRLALHALLIA